MRTCPVCEGVDLLMADRQGIEIDYCPNCRGVWLDSGELDKIIECTHEQYMQAMAPMEALAQQIVAADPAASVPSPVSAPPMPGAVSRPGVPVGAPQPVYGQPYAAPGSAPVDQPPYRQQHQASLADQALEAMTMMQLMKGTPGHGGGRIGLGSILGGL